LLLLSVLVSREEGKGGKRGTGGGRRGELEGVGSLYKSSIPLIGTTYYEKRPRGRKWKQKEEKGGGITLEIGAFKTRIRSKKRTGGPRASD